jgi:hypothetical protein
MKKAPLPRKWSPVIGQPMGASNDLDSIGWWVFQPFVIPAQAGIRQQTGSLLCDGFLSNWARFPPARE